MYRIVEGSLTRSPVIYERYEAVLRAALPGCTSEEERGVIAERLRWLAARRHLAMAQVAARRGDSHEARREARQSLGVTARLSAEALAMAAFPGPVVHLGDRIRGRTVR